jgi:hypothetical protein
MAFVVRSHLFHLFRGSGHFRTATPPSPRKKKKRGASAMADVPQMGLELCLPYGDMNGNKAGILFWK